MSEKQYVVHPQPPTDAELASKLDIAIAQTVINDDDGASLAGAIVEVRDALRARGKLHE